MIRRILLSVAGMIFKLAGSMICLFERSFDGIPISIGDTLKSEVVAV